MSFSVKIAKSRGMCAGVERAIQTVKNAILKFPDQDIFVLHEVVHNKHVVDDLRSIGAHFVDSLEEVPDKWTLNYYTSSVLTIELKKQLDKFEDKLIGRVFNNIFMIIYLNYLIFWKF